ncbi:MAG: manganese efflux pump MntP family protein [Bacteroidales bacterium]|nr:manganese efflux pump MntP family protein [Bacteroidales bacterium]
MNFFEIILLCVALSMDCFTICLIYGAQRSAYRQQLRAGERDPFRPIGADILRIGIVFIAYHLVMLALGYTLGYGVMRYIDVFDHWIAFGLLAAIGLKMVWEAFENKDRKTEIHALYAWSSLLLLGLATSIDAFAVGISLSLSQSSLAFTCLCIPFVLLFFTALGILLGLRVKRISIRAVNVIGGLVLLGIGLRILLAHEYGFSL